MSVRSIDLQVLIPRATEVSRIQQLSNHQAELEQQQSAAQWQQLAAARQQQVQHTPQGAGGKVEPDAKEGKGRREGDGRKGRRRDDEAEAVEGADPVRGHMIDIKT